MCASKSATAFVHDGCARSTKQQRTTNTTRSLLDVRHRQCRAHVATTRRAGREPTTRRRALSKTQPQAFQSEVSLLAAQILLL